MRAPLDGLNTQSPQNLIERMTTMEVMSLARISRATLWRRVAAGRLPCPVDRSRQALFLRFEVVAALLRQSEEYRSVSVAIEQRLNAMRRRRRGSGLDSGNFPE